MKPRRWFVTPELGPPITATTRTSEITLESLMQTIKELRAATHPRMEIQIGKDGLTLIEIPTGTPAYTLNSTVTRFPTQALKDALLSQVQQVIPLIKIQPLQAGYPAIYLSDRRCSVGAQLYQARLVDFMSESHRALGMMWSPDLIHWYWPKEIRGRACASAGAVTRFPADRADRQF